MKGIFEGSKYIDSTKHMKYNSPKLSFLSNKMLGSKTLVQLKKEPISFVQKELMDGG